MSIRDVPADPANYGGVRRLSDIRYIVLHYTANDGDSAAGNGNYFAHNAVKSSAHYFVDSERVVRSVPEQRIAWHCGAASYRHPACRNANSLGVELCDDRKNGRYDFSEDELTLAAALVRELMARYKVPPENVLRHYDVTGKKCPAPFVDDPAAWRAFKKRLEGTKMSAEEAKKILMEKAGLSAETVQFLHCYRYGDELLIKLARAVG